MKIPNKQEFQQTNHSSDIDFDCLKRLFRNITAAIFNFGHWYYSFIRWSITFLKKSIKRSIDSAHDHGWWNKKWKMAIWY